MKSSTIEEINEAIAEAELRPAWRSETMKIIADTNVLLRAVLGDDAEQTAA